MKLWKNPRLAAALCAVVVLVCAAAPAVFLSVVDAASLGHSQAVADPYTAPTPTADDYYLLRQLSARQLTQSKYTFQPGDTGQERKRGDLSGVGRLCRRLVQHRGDHPDDLR